MDGIGAKIIMTSLTDLFDNKNDVQSSSSQLIVKDFFQQQFKPYTIYDTQRSIANVIDGLKITQRKVLYTLLNRGNTSIKVAQLASSVAYETCYHHGEQGISNIICLMAQDFTGSNNINLLEPDGQFGNRLSNVPAAARYIFTKLMPITKTIFRKDDDLILDYLYDDGQRIEPKFYLPILPMILINGSQGIGTGFASKIFSYNPNDVKRDIINILKNNPRTKLMPWYKNYKGTISQGDAPNQWISKGDLEIVNTTTIRITELPIGYYLDDIKSTLSKLKEKDIIKDYDDNSTESGFDIEVTVPRTTTALSIDKLYELFKLSSKDTENLTLWNVNDKLQVFNNASEIIKYFVDFRLTKYESRRLALIEQTKSLIQDLEERIRFINFYLNNTDVFKNTNKKDLFKLLTTNNFINIDGLLSMQIYSLTKDKIAELHNKLSLEKKELKGLEKTNATEMYLKDLEDLTL